MINRARGDAPILIDGTERCLRLTFGALAEIEGGLGVARLGELGARLGRRGAADLMIVLAALLRGSGENEAAAKIGEAQADFCEAACCSSRWRSAHLPSIRGSARARADHPCILGSRRLRDAAGRLVGTRHRGGGQLSAHCRYGARIDFSRRRA